MKVTKFLKAYLPILALTLTTILLLTGCEKEKKKVEKVKVSIRSNPEQVNVTIMNFNNQRFGTTPKSQQLPIGPYILKFQKAGYKTICKKIVCKKGKSQDFEVILKPILSSVVIESIPKGVTISKDNKIIGETPIIIHDLPLGIHSYSLSKPKFSAKELKFSLEDGRPKLVKINMNSNIGGMVIRSTPSNANIFINGEPRGQTPITLQVPQGKYDLKLSLNGYIEQKQKVIVSKGENATVNTKLILKPASLKIITIPAGATLLVNGKRYNNTPTTLKDLKPGTYAIEVAHDKFDNSKREITIAPGQNLTVKLKLDTNMGGIDLIIHPPGVTIYLDGKKMGVTETGETDKLSKIFHIRELKSGPHKITVAHKRGTPLEKNFTINIKKGKTSRPKPFTFWVKDTYLKLKNGQELTGRLSQENENEIHFEHTPNIKIRYKHDEIETIRALKDTE